MKCSSVAQQVDCYLRGTLPEEIAWDVEKHLEACDFCAGSLFDQDIQLDELLRLPWYATNPPDGFPSRVMHQVELVSQRRLLWFAPVWMLFAMFWGVTGIWIVVANRFLGFSFGGVIGAVKTAQVVIATVLEALSMFHFNEFGLFIVCAALSLCLAGIGLISREVLQ